MADVAKSVVRDESKGGGDEEEEEPSLVDVIEEELRNLRTGWTSADSGWSTVEEVARELALAAETDESPPPLSPASPPIAEKNRPATPPPRVITPEVLTPKSVAEHDQKPLTLSFESSLTDTITPESIEGKHLDDSLTNGHVVVNEEFTVRDNSIENTTESVVQEELVVSSTENTVEEQVRICIEEVIDEVVRDEETSCTIEDTSCTVEETSCTIEETSCTIEETSCTVEETSCTIEEIEEIEHSESSVVEKKKKKKTLATIEAGDDSVTTKKKTKKSKKSEGKENNHISVKSSFSKFDQLSKKTIHVRSSDPAKAQKTFSQGSPEGQTHVLCKSCQKQVFAMEQIKAERAVWHKNCFRCNTCNKQLTVDIYQSHEGLLYCKPHFRELFQPKAVIDNEEEPVRRRKPEMIIRENQPIELPPEVVRASDKPDLGLEELSSLNVKSRFQVFEKQQDQADGELERSPTTVSVKRSSSIMSKLAKFQKKGMDVGVTDESLNGFVYEETSSSAEESEDEDEEEDRGVIKCRRKARERPVSFSKMDDVKRNWESVNQSQRREEMREERKQELQQIRSRLFQGKQGKMKELYEQAVAESESKGGRKESGEEIVAMGEKAKLVRERFEKGEAGSGDVDGTKKPVDEDMAVFEEGISKKSRSIFMEMEAAAKATPTQSVAPSQHAPARTDSVRRSRESESPEREVYRDPDVVRCDDKVEDESTILRSQTASRMLSVFRQLEEQKEVLPDGPKPKKCFTPPPDYKASESSEEEGSEDEEDEETEEEEESETEEGVIKSSYKVKDEFLEQSKNAARAKQLAAKFEQWEPEKQSTNNAINMLDSEHASIESTKSLKARFESLQSEQPKEKARPKVNRFVEQPTSTLCAYCDRKVYPLEKIETNGKIFHKNCFRCSYCNCILRMDTYTLNNGHLYCLPHFKQLFISKGNYDEGFGSDQHKRKWEQPVNGNTSS